MDKGCSNHPESMALAVCKVCQKSICLMCVHEEKDGTFCSEECIAGFRGVSDWVSGSATEPQAVPAAVEVPAGSVFEEMPEHAAPVSHPDPVEIPESARPKTPPPTKPATSSIGNPCHAHADIRAKAFCSRCRKAICGLCIIENASGMYCSDACASEARAARRSGSGMKVAVALVVLLGGGAGAAYVFMPELFQGLIGSAAVVPPKRDPVKPPPVKPDPVKPDPVKPDPVKPDPVKPDPVKPEPVKPEPVKPEPVKPEPVKPEPVKPEPVKPAPVKPEPPKPTILVHPWLGEEPGSWFRIRRGNGVEDVGLKARDAGGYTLTTQAWSGGTAKPATEQRVELDPIEIHGEETLEIEGRPYLCEIRGVKTAGGIRKEWSLLTGRHAGAVLRAEAAGDSVETTRVWEHTLNAGLRSFDCLVVEARHADGRQVKTWYSPAYPLRNLRVEVNGTVVEALVDSGDQWASRPAPK